MKRFRNYFRENPIWAKVILFDLTLFLIWLADGIIAFWAPVQIESVLKNSALMGLIISLQSVAGFAADLLFPQILRATSVRRLVLLGIVFVGAASLLLTAASFKPFILIFLITMIIWGIYYEFVGFAYYQFMAASVPLTMRSGASGISSVFSSSAYFLGPLIAPFLINKGSLITELTIFAFLLIAFVLLGLTGKIHNEKEQLDLSGVNPLRELKHWWILGKVVWPVMIMSMVLGFIDSSFWTIGAVWSEKLSHINSLGVLFLPLYTFPAIFVGFFVVRWGIFKGKKILSEKILILAGSLLILLALKSSVYWQLVIVFLASIALSVIGPLVQSVYSDIVARMGHEKKDMIGLTNSVINIAYIIWPPIIGFISLQIGERLSFSYLGLLAILTAIGLLFVTPKKLRLPQTEIQEWK